MKLFLDKLETPLGEIRLVVSDAALVLLDFADNTARMHALLEKRFGAYTLEPRSMPEFREPLAAYFRGELQAVHSLPVNTGVSDFQRSVWAALREIPAGETWSYLSLARRIGNPGAVRAVGATNGLNPVSLVLPCHRVIGSGGSLTGYAGGLERKRWLLEHEARYASPRQAALF